MRFCRLLPALLLGPLAFIGGCQHSQSGATPTSSSKTPLALAPARPVATWQSQRITIADLEPALLEISGEVALQEYVLDLAVDREAARLGINLDADTVIAERVILLNTLASDPDRAERFLQDIRDARGLGPTRFARMLRRSALLRAMVQDELVVSEAIIEAAWDSQHGPRRIARVITVDDPSEANAARQRITSGADFAEVAAEVSLDASAPRGGLLAPVSRLDPAWPTPFREAIFAQEPGELSNPIAVDGRFLLVRVEREEPASGTTLEEGRADAETSARLATQRLLMDRLARRLVDESQINVIERAIRWRSGT